MTKSPARKSASFTYMGQRYYVKGRDEADCKEKIALKLAELENKEKALVNPTVADWAQTWLDTYVKPKVRKPGTAKRRNTMTEKSYSMYERMINNIIIPAIGRKKLEAVTDTHLRNILNREATKSFSHVSKLRIVIKAMFSQAVASRVIIFDPSLKLELPAAEKGRRRALTAAEREAFDVVVECNKHGLWAKFLIGTGVRPNECSALTVADLDESGTKALGGGPKSHAGLRQIPIPLDLADELKRPLQRNLPQIFCLPSETEKRWSQKPVYAGGGKILNVIWTLLSERSILQRDIYMIRPICCLTAHQCTRIRTTQRSREMDIA